MVDNSLGKYWLDHYPNSELRNKLKYLIPDKYAFEQATSVSNLKPEELKIIDNAMGSGHIFSLRLRCIDGNLSYVRIF